ncbi:MAG: hypothetical protein RL607_2190 [Bacteroidota bacterium]
MRNKGLTSKAVHLNYLKWGYNEATKNKEPHFGTQLIKMLKEPVILLLITCNILYLLIGNKIEGIALTISLVVMISISYYQFRKTQKTLVALKELQTPFVEVVRDGITQLIPCKELVPGDLLNIHEGARIGADAKLIDATHLFIDESMVTGESLPMAKSNQDELIGGTLVVSGKGQAIVTAIGNWSTLGKMEKTMQPVAKPLTASQQEMKRLIKVFFAIGIVYTLFIVFYLTDTRGHFTTALLTGLSTAIALIPEEFPVVFFLFTAFGAWRLAQIKIVAQSPETLESLGAITILGLDKTGTLTENKMVIEKIATPKGIVLSLKANDSITPTADAIIHTAVLATQEMKTDAIDRVLIEWNNKKHPDQPIPQAIHEFSMDNDFPATAQIRVLENNTSSYQISLKGAPEWVLERCLGNHEEKKQRLDNLFLLTREGYRVIAIAHSMNWNAPLPKAIGDLNFTYVGLIAFADPLRPEALTVLQDCRKAGIRPVMMTGDHPVTAQHIAQQLQWENLTYLEGVQVDALSDIDLQKAVQNCSLFARIRFEQKIRIIEALKKNGETVAMTGDGINDAGALRAAQIGIAMGKKGTDVAREAAALILIEDNLNALPKAIYLGRRVMDNLKKAFGFIIAVHIPILTATCIPLINNDIPLLLFPMHIVFLELIIDPISAIAFENEAEEKKNRTQPPHLTKTPFFERSLWISSGLKGGVMALIMSGLTLNEAYHGASENNLRSVFFLCIIASAIVLTIHMISKSRPLWHFYKAPNWPLFTIILIVSLLTIGLYTIPFFHTIFQIDSLPYRIVLHIVGSYFGILLLVECFKLYTKKVVHCNYGN